METILEERVRESAEHVKGMVTIKVRICESASVRPSRDDISGRAASGGAPEPPRATRSVPMDAQTSPASVYPGQWASAAEEAALLRELDASARYSAVSRSERMPDGARLAQERGQDVLRCSADEPGGSAPRSSTPETYGPREFARNRELSANKDFAAEDRARAPERQPRECKPSSQCQPNRARSWTTRSDACTRLSHRRT